MKHGKYWIFVAAAGAAIVLSACSAGFVPVDNGNESRPDGGKTESIGTEFVEKETSKPEYQPLSKEERRTIVDTLEAFDPDQPEYSPYGSPIVNSYCHAWSCTPVYLLKKYVKNK